MTDTKPTLSVEDAVKLLNQERLDIMCEGATQEDCEMQPAYVVLSAYNETKASLLRCQEIVHEKDRELAALRGRRMEPDGLARACNLAGLDYNVFLKICAYLPVEQSAVALKDSKA